MGGEIGLFLDACGAGGPLCLEWDDHATGQPVSRAFVQAAVLVGRGLACDLILEHPDVGLRHAYLQLIEGRLYAIDLESRTGLRWDGVPRLVGWVDRRRPLQVGPTTLTIVGGGRAGDDHPAAGPGPLSSRYLSPGMMPLAWLEVRGGLGGAVRRDAMDRMLVLVGSSEKCGLRLREPDASRFVCSLVRTPAGVWVVDLLSSRGVALNGAVCRGARLLEDGDVLKVGDQTIRLIYDGTSTSGGSRSLAVPAGRHPALPSASPASAGFSPDLILRPMLDGNAPSPDDGASPFGQALLMLIRLLGDMHGDHLQLVREELEEIRRLGREMVETRARPLEGPSGVPSAGTVDESAPDEAGDSPFDRPGPQSVQLLVGERLEAWERERQSRWRKVLDLLLVKP